MNVEISLDIISEYNNGKYQGIYSKIRKSYEMEGYHYIMY